MIEDPRMRFSYRGIYYSNEDDFFSAVTCFNLSPISDESVDELVTELGTNIKINISPTLGHLTNNQLRIILYQTFENMFKEAAKEAKDD